MPPGIGVLYECLTIFPVRGETYIPSNVKSHCTSLTDFNSHGKVVGLCKNLKKWLSSDVLPEEPPNR